MADPDTVIPMLIRRPPTVSFIDNHLPKYHPVFATSTLQYDPMTQNYVANNQALVSGAQNSLVTGVASAAAVSNSSNPISRPVLTDTKAMIYWNDIFSEAMARFRSTREPKGRSQIDYNIRDKSDWDSVYETLSLARKTYQESGGRVGGWLKRVRRKAADNITPGVEAAKAASKMVPNDPFATPVLGAVEVLLDAVKSAASVRNQLLQDLDGLIAIFSDVETFLATFPDDRNIWNASVELTVTTLDTIERAIGFFISNQFMRGGKALGTGDDYEKSLLDSLEKIQTKSRDLMQEAIKSHLFQAHLYSQETKKILNQIVCGVRYVGTAVNDMKHLLDEHVRIKDEQLRAAQEEVIQLRVENGILRAASPLQYGISPPPSQQTETQAAMQWYISPGTLLQILDTSDSDHLSDTAFINEKKEQLPSSERALTEQIIGTRLFRNWVVAPSSSKLLIHWDFRLPKSIAGVSPISVFCTNLVKALHGSNRFISALFFCGLHIDPVECHGSVGGRAMLTSLIVQLLKQHPFDTRPLHRDVNLEGLQVGSLIELTNLLFLLIRQLPEALTLLLIIDGAIVFEREEFATDALPVFSSLLQLSADSSISASVKVLITSTPGTDIIRGAFEEEDLILNVDRLPRLCWPASEERMNRELGGEIRGAFVGDDRIHSI